MSLLPKSRLGITLACIGMAAGLMAILALIVAVIYKEEDTRGLKAWNQVKSEVEAKGGTVDWNQLIPPPVPDDQNFFKAPKMSDWFVKPTSEVLSNDFTSELDPGKFTSAYNTSNSLALAEVKIIITNEIPEPPDKADIVIRYFPEGSMFFIEANPVIPQSLSKNIPVIEFQDIPISVAIESLAREGSINYLLDPNVGYGMPDVNGHIKPEPTCSLIWRNITARQALLALLHQYGFQFIDNPKTGIAQITIQSQNAPKSYITPDDLERLEHTLRRATGPEFTGLEGPLVLARTPNQVQPLHIVCYAEKTPPLDNLKNLFEQIFYNQANLASANIQVRSAGNHVFRVTANAASATDFLHWSDGLKPDLDLIREALKRPYFRREGDYSNPFSVPLPNFIAIRLLEQTLGQRAQCHLLLNQPELALEDLTLINDSRRIMEDAPTGKPMPLVSAMINVAVTGIYVNAVGNGQSINAWREPQLNALQSQMKQINLAPFVVGGLHHEQVMSVQGAKSFVFNARKNLPYHWWPVGWNYQNMARAVELEQRFIDGIDIKDNIVVTTQIDAAGRDGYAVESEPNHLPFNILASVVGGSFSKAVQAFALDQTKLNEAQLACALERYHLVHGAYPGSLDLLSPQYITQIPHDLIGGKLLHYRLNDDGSFTLYSIGWNEIDDGGEAIVPFDLKTGDWVWLNYKW